MMARKLIIPDMQDFAKKDLKVRKYTGVGGFFIVLGVTIMALVMFLVRATVAVAFIAIALGVAFLPIYVIVHFVLKYW